MTFRSYSITILVFGFLLLLFSCTRQPPDQLTINNPEALDAILDEYVEEGHLPFIYARLERLDGSIMYEHSTVNNKLLPNRVIDKDSWIRIWSMSKIVTISVALDLIEEGLLDFNDPVTKYIPEFKNLKVALSADGKSLTDLDWNNRENACPIQLVPNDSIMTVLHLFNHEAGFYYATTQYECLDSTLADENVCTAKNTDEFIKRLAEVPLIQHPGTDHFYGINTTVLGFVAERATGKSLKELVKERITEPLKIEGLQYGLEEYKKLPPTVSGKDTILRYAHPGELDIFGADVPDYNPAHALYLGGEGMVATADGYADFVRMLLNRGTLNDKRFLNKSTVEDIYAPHTQLDNPYGYNGYNLWISGDSMRIYESGEAGLWIGGGYEGTHFWADPKREFVGIIMSQISFAQPEGYTKDDKFRGAVYKQFWESEEMVK